MNKTLKVIAVTVFATSMLGVAGCSDEQKEKWGKAADAVGDAAKTTASDVKEGAQDAIKNAKPTDPDTGEAIRD